MRKNLLKDLAIFAFLALANGPSACEATASLSTNFAGTSIMEGDIWTITTGADGVSIEQLAIHMDSNTINIEVYSRPGEAHTEYEASYQKVLDEMVTGQGQGVATLLSPFGSPIDIPPNSSHTFYTTGTDDPLSIYYTDGSSVLSTFASDPYIDVKEGYSVRFPFNVPRSPTQWNGVVYYSVAAPAPSPSPPSLPPTLSPIAAPPSPPPTLSPIAATYPPTASPTNESSSSPSVSAEPSSVPSLSPSKSSEPSLEPSMNPSLSDKPSFEPSMSPSLSGAPSESSAPPTASPTNESSSSPSVSAEPSSVPSLSPSESSEPSLEPSMNPSLSDKPSFEPSMSPSLSGAPSESSAPPTASPTNESSSSPSLVPSMSSSSPSLVPSMSSSPSSEASLTPSQNPTNTSMKPSMHPSLEPSSLPTKILPQPTSIPSSQPTLTPTSSPSHVPSSALSTEPSLVSNTPSVLDTQEPTLSPSQRVTQYPSKMIDSSNEPSVAPSLRKPSNNPTAIATPTVSMFPTFTPSEGSSFNPTPTPSTPNHTSIPSSINPTHYSDKEDVYTVVQNVVHRIRRNAWANLFHE